MTEQTPSPLLPFFNSNGVTVAELKRFIANWPEKDESGEDYTVWIESGKHLSSVVTAIWPLNKRPDGADIILEHTGAYDD